MTILCGLAAAYTGWIMYSRWQANREAEQAAEREKARQMKLVLEPLGNDVKILTFYASPPAIHRGEKTLLCYGVANARKVAIDPYVDGVWPSNSRCIEVSPSKTTTYTVTATDANGRTAAQSTEVQLH